MRFFSKEFLPPAVLIIAAVIFGLLLYHDMSASIDISSGKKIGKIEFASRTAQRKYNEQVIWESVDSNTPVYNGDSIRTADLSEAVISLADGTDIVLHENSMVLLQVASKKMEVDFSRGSMTARKKKGDGDLQLAITAGALNVAVDESHLMLKKEADNSIDVTVQEGEARLVSEGKDDVVVSDNQKAELRPGRDSPRVVSLPVKLLAPANGTFFAGRDDTQSVWFQWEFKESMPGAVVEIARDSSFRNMVERISAKGNSTVVGLQEGAYFWRITGKQEADMLPAWNTFTVLKMEPLTLQLPRKNDIIRISDKNNLVRFMWEPHRHTGSYVLVVAKDPEMENITLRQNSIVTDTAVNIKTGPGTYYWAVWGEARAPGLEEYRVKSGVRKFSLKAGMSPSSIELIRPEPEAMITRDAVNLEAVPFSWRKEQGAEEYELQVADNPSFSSNILTERSSGNVVMLKESLKPGRYYWRVAPVVEGKTREDLFSPSRMFSVSLAFDIGLVSPERSAEISIPSGRNDIPVTFRWKGYTGDYRYKLEISAGYNYSDIYASKVVSENSVTLPSIEAGEYFWRITLISPDGEELTRSAPRLVKVRGSLGRPVAVTPRSGDIVNLKTRNYFTLAWESVPGADLYRVKLSHIKGSRKKEVKEYSVTTTSVRMDQLYLLEEGRFEWSIKALDTARDDKNVVLRESPESNNRFIVTLGRRMVKPKIISPKIQYEK